MECKSYKIPGKDHRTPLSNDVDHSFITRKYLNVPYASISHAQKMDVYLPKEGNGPFPCIIFIHGGAFCICDKADGQVQPYLEATKRGYVVASINYRLSGEAIFPAAVHDCKAATRYLKAHAGEYCIDTGHIAVAGGSAGGNLAALMCTTAEVSGLEDFSLGNAGYSSSVNTGVVWFGPTDFLKMDAQLAENNLGPCDHNDADSPESRYMGGKITDLEPSYVQKANPMTYVSKKMSPIFLEHGRLDHLVPYQQSVIFAQKIRQIAGDDKVQFEILETADHGDKQFETNQNMEKVFAFIEKHI